MIKRLLDLRQKYNLTQQEIAGKLNISRATYASYEVGNRIIPLKYIYQLALFYNVSLNYIVGLTNKKNIESIKQGSLNSTNVGKRLLEVRNEFHLSMRDLAQVLNTTPSTICAYEKGKTMLLTAFAIQIGKTYAISLDWLCGLSEQKFIEK